MSSRSYEGGAAGGGALFGDPFDQRVVVVAERVEDVWPDEDLDRRREQLVPLAAAAGDQPGGEWQEERGQLDQRVREDAEDQFEPADVELESEGRALEAEVEGLGREREDRHRGDEADRQLAGLDVDPAREAGPLLGGERHRG